MDGNPHKKFTAFVTKRGIEPFILTQHHHSFKASLHLLAMGNPHDDEEGLQQVTEAFWRLQLEEESTHNHRTS